MRKAFVNDIATELIKMTAVRHELKVFHLRVLALASPDIKNSLQNLFLVVSFSCPAVHYNNLRNILASKTYCKLNFQVPDGSNIDLFPLPHALSLNQQRYPSKTNKIK